MGGTDTLFSNTASGKCSKATLPSFGRMLGSNSLPWTTQIGLHSKMTCKR